MINDSLNSVIRVIPEQLSNGVVKELQQPTKTLLKLDEDNDIKYIYCVDESLPWENFKLYHPTGYVFCCSPYILYNNCGLIKTIFDACTTSNANAFELKLPQTFSYRHKDLHDFLMALHNVKKPQTWSPLYVILIAHYFDCEEIVHICFEELMEGFITQRCKGQRRRGHLNIFNIISVLETCNLKGWKHVLPVELGEIGSDLEWWEPNKYPISGKNLKIIFQQIINPVHSDNENKLASMVTINYIKRPNYGYIPPSQVKVKDGVLYRTPTVTYTWKTGMTASDYNNLIVGSTITFDFKTPAMFQYVLFSTVNSRHTWRIDGSNHCKNWIAISEEFGTNKLITLVNNLVSFRFYRCILIEQKDNPKSHYAQEHMGIKWIQA